MPVSSVDVRDGDPTVQASGQHRGTITATFSDGRILERNLRAADADGWADAVANAGLEAQSQMENRDAEAAVTPDADVVANLEANIAQTCVAYIRAAWELETAYDAFALYSRINTYITTHSDWNTAHTHLLAEGLTQEEFDQAKAAYQYLSGSGRPAILSDAQTIQAAWEDQH